MSDSKINYKKVGMCILFFLALCIFTIVLYNHYKTYFKTHSNNSISNFQNIPLVNVDSADLHFIKDDNIDLIDTPLYNYKLQINPIQTEKEPTPSKTSPTINYIYEKYENITTKNNKSNSTNITKSSTMKYLSVFMHKPFQNYRGLGQCVVITDTPLDENNKKTVIQSLIDKKCLIYLSSSNFYPVDYQLIWSSDINTDNKVFRIWRPIPIAGCAVLGDVIMQGTEKPPLDYIPCFPITMLKQDDPPVSNGLLWKTSNDMGANCYCWSGGNVNTFFASSVYKHDMIDLLGVYNLPNEFLSSNTVLTTPENKEQGIRI
jgi:hypothetical protein